MKNYNWEFLSDDTFVVLDIETTGLSPQKGAKIIEIGAVKVRDGKIIDTFSYFVNPEIKIPKKITEITGITNEMINESPYIGRVLLELKEFIHDTTIVAHNSSFDWDRFLLDGFKKIGFNAKNNTIDTIHLSKLTFKEHKKHNLKDMCTYLEIDILNHHRAIDDAYMTANAFIKFLEIHKDKIPNKVKEPSIQKLKNDSVSIKRVKYWELLKGKKVTHKRHYINLFYNNKFIIVYFDINTKCWYVKENNENMDINLNLIEKKVLEFLKVDDLEKLCEFRN